MVSPMRNRHSQSVYAPSNLPPCITTNAMLIPSVFSTSKSPQHQISNSNNQPNSRNNPTTPLPIFISPVNLQNSTNTIKIPKHHFILIIDHPSPLHIKPIFPPFPRSTQSLCTYLPSISRYILVFTLMPISMLITIIIIPLFIKTNIPHTIPSPPLFFALSPLTPPSLPLYPISTKGPYRPLSGDPQSNTPTHISHTHPFYPHHANHHNPNNNHDAFPSPPPFPPQSSQSPFYRIPITETLPNHIFTTNHFNIILYPLPI